MRQRRIAMAIIGIFLTAVSVAFQKIAGFGVDPFSVLMFGVAETLGVTYQTVFMSFCVVLTGIAWKFKSSLLGLSTIISLTCFGLFVDLSSSVLHAWIEKPGTMMRIFFMIFALVLISISSALYYSADLGVSPYDAQALIIADRTPVPFKWARVGTDLVSVVIGYLLGGDLGVGTVIVAFCMGPAIQFCREYISDPLVSMESSKATRRGLTKNAGICILNRE